MREAYRKFYEDNDQSHDIVDIMDHLSYSLSQYGLKKLAFQVNLKAFEIIDESPKGNYDEEVVNRILQNKKYYEHNYGENPTFEVNFLEANIPKPSRQYRFDEFETYEDLCRQTNIYDRMPKDQKDKLICKYSTQNNNPRLILKPAKMEYIRMNPDFVFFHDVVSHEETEILKEMAKPKLQRATIQNPRTGNLEFAEYRVSKHAWLGPDSGETVANIFSRVMDLIGLDVRGLASEDLQIGDYGVGGQYEPHYDHATKNTAGDFGQLRGNRIATVLFYFTETEKGGNTVFLYPKLAIPPSKGGFAFWYNLKPSGESDDSTRHAACPILVGQKWVANYWIHERGQEFRRKCTLNREDESSFDIDGWRGVGKEDRFFKIVDGRDQW